MHCIEQLAVVVLTQFFGAEWRKRFCPPLTSESDFLRAPAEDRKRMNVRNARIVSLPEMIINLQSVAGLENVLDQIQNGKIESGFAELETGKLLVQYGIAFRYIKPQKVKGKDYDVELFHPNGDICCAETKCKIEKVEFEADAVQSRLGDAREQVPKDRPSIIFIKLPQQWFDTGNPFMPQFERAVWRFLGATKRVVSVIGFTNHVKAQNGEVREWLYSSEFVNRRHRFDPSRDWRLVRRFEDIAPFYYNWIHLIGIADRGAMGR